jgi:hypothetical protein
VLDEILAQPVTHLLESHEIQGVTGLVARVIVIEIELFLWLPEFDVPLLSEVFETLAATVWPATYLTIEDLIRCTCG